MIRHAGETDAGYLRGRLQEARWLLKSLEARGDTLLKVMRCLVRQQSGFLEFGAQALRPLTLREVAAEVGLHESTVSRAIARKYVRTPRGTMPLRALLRLRHRHRRRRRSVQHRHPGDDPPPDRSREPAQAAVRRHAWPRSLKAAGVPVARRTVAKYREAMNIPSSHERVRIG